MAGTSDTGMLALTADDMHLIRARVGDPETRSNSKVKTEATRCQRNPPRRSSAQISGNELGLTNI